jgi:hypothetical protein
MSTLWKAQANGMIIQLTNDLREKDVSMLELQNKLDKLSTEKHEQQQKQQSIIRGESQEKEIAQLKLAMEEAQLKAKERMKQKNQSLKEMEDMVMTLTDELEDVKREKDKLNGRLINENQRSKRYYEIHERQIRQTEERLSKEHLAAMSGMEDEMNRIVRQLETEIESLKSRVATGSSSSQGMAPMKSAQHDYLKVQEMEEVIRRSKETEVSLINQNMQMKHKIKDLQQMVEERATVGSTEIHEEAEDASKSIELSLKALPNYYRERQRPQVIKFVGNAWKKMFRRKNMK